MSKTKVQIERLLREADRDLGRSLTAGGFCRSHPRVKSLNKIRSARYGHFA
jgi:hypothetical protein